MATDGRDWLLVRAPGASEQQLPLAVSPCRIGRGPENLVVLDDEYVSATHAEMVQHDGWWYVRDLGSTNGTELNGQPLRPDQPTLLRSGDDLQVGSFTLTYLDGAAALTPSLASRRGSLLGTLLRLGLLAAVLLAL